MFARRTHSSCPKSLPDVLEEELDGKIGPDPGVELSEAQQQARLKEIYKRIHSLETKRSALCLSGGGIRSASFGLGVLQALARADLLEKFDYLSTVSGGGYIGGWLSAWIHHHPSGREGVLTELKTTPDRMIEPESDPIRHLRAFSNYLMPRFGLFSADTWAIGATVLRDILLNWIVLLSWLAVLLLIPRFCVLARSRGPPRPRCSLCLLPRSFAWQPPRLTPPSTFRVLATRAGRNAAFSLGWFAPMLAAAFFLFAWWAGFRNTSELAGPLMSSPWGLPLTQLIVGLASAAGCLAARWLRGISRSGSEPVASRITQTPQPDRNLTCDGAAHRSVDRLLCLVDRGEGLSRSG